MKVPVIIAAHDEAAFIGRTLDRLDSHSVEPRVVVNGEPCDGPTAREASRFNVQVLQLEEAGKLPAIQHSLRSLGQRALDPILFMDADSYPAFPLHWASSMLRQLPVDRPAVVAGLYAFTGGSPIDNAVRSARRIQRSVEHRIKKRGDSISGLNMGIHILTERVLDQVLEMPNTWPGEDRALSDEVTGKKDAYSQSLDPRSLVFASARYHHSLWTRVARGADYSREKTMRDYLDRAPSGTVMKYVNGTYMPLEEEPGDRGHVN